MNTAPLLFSEIKHHNQLTELIIKHTKGCFTLAERSVLSYLSSQGFWDRNIQKSKNIKVSVTSIENNTGISRRTVFRSLKKLKSLQILESILEIGISNTFSICVINLENYISNNKKRGEKEVGQKMSPVPKCHQCQNVTSAPVAPLLVSNGTGLFINNIYKYNNNSACAREDEILEKTAEIINFPKSSIKITSSEKPQVSTLGTIQENIFVPNINPIVTVNAPQMIADSPSLQSDEYIHQKDQEGHLVVKIGALEDGLPLLEGCETKKTSFSESIAIESLDKSVFQKIGTENGIHVDWIDEVFQKFLEFNQKRNHKHPQKIWLKFWVSFCNHCYETYKNPKVATESSLCVSQENIFETNEPSNILEFRKKLCEAVSVAKYVSWFQKTEMCIKNNFLCVYVTNDFQKDYILNKFSSNMEIINNLTLQLARVCVEVKK